MMSSEPNAAIVASTSCCGKLGRVMSPASCAARPPAALDGARCLRGGIGVQIVDHHRGARGRQLLSDRAADAASRAGDQRDS